MEARPGRRTFYRYDQFPFADADESNRTWHPLPDGNKKPLEVLRGCLLRGCKISVLQFAPVLFRFLHIVVRRVLFDDLFEHFLCLGFFSLEQIAASEHEVGITLLL